MNDSSCLYYILYMPLLMLHLDEEMLFFITSLIFICEYSYSENVLLMYHSYTGLQVRVW